MVTAVQRRQQRKGDGVSMGGGHSAGSGSAKEKEGEFTPQPYPCSAKWQGRGICSTLWDKPDGHTLIFCLFSKF